MLSLDLAALYKSIIEYFILSLPSVKNFKITAPTKFTLFNLNPELSKLSINDFSKFKGIGEKKAITIITALELGRRRREAEVIERKKITSSNSN